MTDPLHFSFEVGCTPETAFALWTSTTSTWWPVNHTVSGAQGLEVVFEGWVGGRIYERTPAGVEHDWGTVRSWEPPSLVAYSWHLRAEPSDATDVEVRFTDLGGTTRVEIEHRGWERLGAAASGRREGNRHGWESVLTYFITAVSEGEY